VRCKPDSADAQVVLLDHAKKLGEKIRISGGGHCNFTNLNIKPDNFISSNPILPFGAGALHASGFHRACCKSTTSVSMRRRLVNCSAMTRRK